MPDWKKLTEDAAKAATLDTAALDQFLTRDRRDAEEQSALQRLVSAQRVGGFMATSAPAQQVSEQAVGAIGDEIGSWSLETLLGRGGMGEVWRAARSDGLYDQTVALKLMRPGDERRNERFDLERRRLALMEHPGVSRIVDGGVTDDGVPFMAMEYVDGIPVDAYVRGRSRRDTLRLMADLCDAVHHAHGKFVLHRDIKADNVLVDRNGQIRLIDFGISSAMEDAETGGPLTLATAAPEQLIGTPPVSVATDVFALGVLMHQLLTGELPERRPDGSVAIDEKAVGSVELTSIIRRATAFSQNDRYSSADALAADIRNWINRRPVLVHEGGATYRFRKFLQRFPVASAMGAAFLIALVGGLATSLWFADQARQQADAAEVARIEAEAERESAILQSQISDLNVVGQTAFIELLIDAYADEEDPTRLSNRLMERWRSTHETFADAPEQTAAISLAAARGFYLRRDYKNAITVLEDWLAEGYGPPQLILNGKQILGLALFDIGQRGEAVPILREVLDGLDAERQPRLMDQSDVALRIAMVTREADAIARAAELLDARANLATIAEEKIEILGSLSALYFMQDDFPSAHKAITDALALFAGDDGLNPAMGRSVLRHNAADIEIYQFGDLDIGRSRLEAILTEDILIHGENSVTAAANSNLAWVLWFQGEPELALERTEDAIRQYATYGNGPEAGRSAERVVKILSLADMGRTDEALAEAASLDVAQTGIPDTDRRHSRLRLAEAYVRSLAGEPGSVSVTADPNWIDQDKYQRLIKKRLEERGIEIEATSR